MSAFKTRWKLVWDDFLKWKDLDIYKQIPDRHKTSYNTNFLKSKREGNYLIKIGKNNNWNYCGEGKTYVDFTYKGDGWFALGPRSEAQWFTGKEAHDFVNRTKGFAVVKRIKN